MCQEYIPVLYPQKCRQRSFLSRWQSVSRPIEKGLYPVAGSDSLDWKDYDAETIYNRVSKALQPGSIVLFHNAALHTPEALPSILEFMQQNGYTVVPIGELIHTGTYTIDHTGRQFPAESPAN